MSAAIPCPRCRAPLALPLEKCAACGSPPIVDRAEGEDTPTCAQHPARVASAACSRCGVFGCAICLTVAADALVCRKCRPAPPPAIPWEDPTRRLPVRFFATVWAFCMHPIASAREVKGGPLIWPWIFALLCFAPQIPSWGIALESLPEYGEESLEVVGVITVFFALVWLFVLPLGEFLTLGAMGIWIPFGRHLRATAYSSGVFLVPLCSCVAIAVWGPWLRLVTLRTTFELSWVRALLAVSALPLTVACAVLATRADLRFWA